MFNLDFADRHVVVTGGTGALGAAVVQVLIDSGAVLHVPSLRHPTGVAHERIHVEFPIDLTDEVAVSHFYGSLPSLWASVHVAGGFAAGSIGETSLEKWQQMQISTALPAFCVAARRSRGFVGQMTAGGSSMLLPSRR